jgi:hypothetical protein
MNVRLFKASFVFTAFDDLRSNNSWIDGSDVEYHLQALLDILRN